MMICKFTNMLLMSILLVSFSVCVYGEKVLLREDFSKRKSGQLLQGEGWESAKKLLPLSVAKTGNRNVIRGKNAEGAGAEYTFAVQKKGIVTARVLWNLGNHASGISILRFEGNEGQYIEADVRSYRNGIRMAYNKIPGYKYCQQFLGNDPKLGHVRPLPNRWYITELRVDLDHSIATCRWKQADANFWMFEGHIAVPPNVRISKVAWHGYGPGRPMVDSITVSVTPSSEQNGVQPSNRNADVLQIIRRQQYSQNGYYGADILINSPGRNHQLEVDVLNSLGLLVRTERYKAKKKTKIIIPPHLKVAVIAARLRNEHGRVIAQKRDFIAIEPKSLKPVEGSERFGIAQFPRYLGHDNNRWFQLLGASGCKSLRGFDMIRCFTTHNIDPPRVLDPVSDVRAAGVTKLISILGRTPEWASTIPEGRPERERTHAMPRKNAWQSMLLQYIKTIRFEGYEVWNEPNGGSWNTYPKMQTYAKLCQITNEVFKKLMPNARIAVGVANNGEPGWPDGVLRLAPGSGNVVSFHCYRYGTERLEPELDTNRFPSYMKMVARMLEMTKKHNNGNPIPLWVTEFGYPCPDLKRPDFDMQDQAELLIRSFLTLAASGVETSCNFLLTDVPHQGFHFGLARKDEEISIKPSFLAFRTLNQQTAGRNIGKLRPISNNVYTLTFQSNKDDIMAIWTVLDPAVVSVTGNIDQVKDLYGRIIKTESPFVIPAGSLIYLKGNNLENREIKALFDVESDTDMVVMGRHPQYFVPGAKSVQIVRHEAIKDNPKHVVGYGLLRVDYDGRKYDIPVEYSVTDSVSVTLDYDKNGKPVIIVFNGRDQPEKLDLTFSINNTVLQKEVNVKSGESISIPISMMSKPSDNVQPVLINIKQKNKTWSMQREIWAPTVAVELSSADHKPYELDHWKGDAKISPPESEDLSAVLKFYYDNQYMHITVDVTDEMHHQNAYGTSAWKGDSVKLAFVQKTTSAAKEMLFFLNIDGKKGMYSFDPELNIDNVKYDILRKGDKTQYRISLPLLILGVKPTEKDRLRFSLILNENDGDKRDGYLRFGDGIGEGKYPSQYGVTIFK